jgi:two-component system cell cycle response regulator
VPGRVLVIEDNAESLELMSYLLKATGHTVLAARDGEEGLTVVRSALPDLIVCDIQLPKLDGLGVACILRNDPRLRAIPRLAVTALAMVGDRERILAAGFDGYISKPIAPDIFIGQVQSFVRGEFPPAASTRCTLDGARPEPQRATILVVDNRPDAIYLARSILEPFGYSVLAAYGVPAALTLAREARPDLIVSDVHMSPESGYDLLGLIQADRELRSIPLMFVSASIIPEQERARALQLGAAGFLSRPIEPRELISEIEAHLSAGKRIQNGNHSHRGRPPE